MLCTVGASDGLLQGTFPRSAPQAIRGREELEAFLEGTVARYVELLEQPRRSAGARSPGELAPSERERLHDFEIVPLEAGPLLTAEELEAFREPLLGEE